MWRVLRIFCIFVFIFIMLWNNFTYYQETDREFKRLNSIYGTVYIITELFSNYWPYSIFINWMISFFLRWDKLKPMYNIWCLSKYTTLFIIIWEPLWNLIRYVRVTGADYISENFNMDQHGSVTADEPMDAELDDNQETILNVMAVDKTLASKTNESDDTVSAGESMDVDLDDNQENTQSSEVVATEAEDLEENGGTILQSTNVPNNNGMEYSRENLVLQKSENQTFNDTKESLKTTVKLEVSLRFRKEEDSKGRFPPTNDPQKFQSIQATSSDLVVSYTFPLEDTQDHETTESSIPDNTDVCKNQVQPVNLQNHQACGFNDTNPSSTPGDYKVERSSDKHKQENKLLLNLPEEQSCDFDETKPGPTLTSPEDGHDKYSYQQKQMTKKTENLLEEPTKSTTTQADRKTQKARSSDQDNVCLNGQPSSSQEAPVELHPTIQEAQKKQKGTDADVEIEDKPSDGRPSVKDKGTTQLTEEPANLTLQTYNQSSMSKMSISLSAGSCQNGNQPVTIQRDHTEKWPTESSSDSE